MTDPMDKVTEGKDLLGKVQNFVSGFVGYYDRERRRDADKLLRDTVADRYEEHWDRVSAIQARMIGAKMLEFVDDVEVAAIKLRTFVDRVRGAPRGYAGFFDAVRINQDELESLYQYDIGLLDFSDQVAEAVDGLEAAITDPDNMPAAIKNLVDVADQASRAYDRRSEAILNEQES
ncbi:MAG: hypothetical protein J4N82_00840 [Chloroflexi bacterium]|nr:hypothetical protein [Chloroflexota bacterium]MCI0805449.1 hypothetical protein [Chloroflexota bacterium]MCI0860473.1 hypothetical protein [Chloroflexota bacterium]